MTSSQKLPVLYADIQCLKTPRPAISGLVDQALNGRVRDHYAPRQARRGAGLDGSGCRLRRRALELATSRPCRLFEVVSHGGEFERNARARPRHRAVRGYLLRHRRRRRMFAPARTDAPATLRRLARTPGRRGAHFPVRRHRPRNRASAMTLLGDSNRRLKARALRGWFARPDRRLWRQDPAPSTLPSSRAIRRLEAAAVAAGHEPGMTDAVVAGIRTTARCSVVLSLNAERFAAVQRRLCHAGAGSATLTDAGNAEPLTPPPASASASRG